MWLLLLSIVIILHIVYKTAIVLIHSYIMENNSMQKSMHYGKFAYIPKSSYKYLDFSQKIMQNGTYTLKSKKKML